MAEYILLDYRKTKNLALYEPIDIEDFATTYLGMHLKYKSFEDQGIAGMRCGTEIVLDERLKEEQRLGEHNFTLAHECAHELINWQDENFSEGLIKQYRTQRPRKQLITDHDFAEWQANVVAAYLLMPPDIVGWCMFTFARKEKIKLYGDYYMAKEDRMAVSCIKSYLKVSRQALMIRLKELDLIEYHPIDEYYDTVRFMDMLKYPEPDWRCYYGKKNQARSRLY